MRTKWRTNPIFLLPCQKWKNSLLSYWYLDIASYLECICIGRISLMSIMKLYRLRCPDQDSRKFCSASILLIIPIFRRMIHLQKFEISLLWSMNAVCCIFQLNKTYQSTNPWFLISAKIVASSECLSNRSELDIRLGYVYIFGVRGSVWAIPGCKITWPGAQIETHMGAFRICRAGFNCRSSKIAISFVLRQLLYKFPPVAAVNVIWIRSYWNDAPKSVAWLPHWYEESGEADSRVIRTSGRLWKWSGSRVLEGHEECSGFIQY